MLRGLNLLFLSVYIERERHNKYINTRYTYKCFAKCFFFMYKYLRNVDNTLIMFLFFLNKRDHKMYNVILGCTKAKINVLINLKKCRGCILLTRVIWVIFFKSYFIFKMYLLIYLNCITAIQKLQYRDKCFQ